MQKVKNKTWGLLIGFCILNVNLSSAQELTQIQMEYFEDIFEENTDNEDNSTDLSALMEYINDLMEHPVNLNSASKEELSLLPFLNDFQIASLVDYRRKNGLIFSVYELQYIPGFRQEEVELIKPFVYIGESTKDDSFSEAGKLKFKHMLVLRYQRILEDQKGYFTIPDSVLLMDPDKTRYLGSPDKLFLRYKLNAGRNLTLGLTAEKDPGEEFFRGTNKTGFDFYSAFFLFQKEKSVLRKLIIGDFHIRQGQGLLLWSSYLPGKSSNLDNLIQRTSDLIPSRSAEENNFFRGVAMKLCKGHFNFQYFISYKSLDITPVDSESENSFFKSFRRSGIHATPSEIRGEKAVDQTSVGGSVRFMSNRLKVGLNGHYSAFNKEMIKSGDLYKVYNFRGNSLAGFSLDYIYLGEQFQFFGEAARAYQGYSTLNGLLVFLNSSIQLGAIHRYYQPTYYSFYANSFRENSLVNNEKGFFLGAEISFLSCLLKIYGDIFAFPWLKYGIAAPSQGNDISIELSKQFAHVKIHLRYRRKESEINLDPQETHQVLGTRIKTQLRFNQQFNPVQNLRLQNRVEMVRIKRPEGNLENGYLFFQDLGFNFHDYPFNLAIRIAYFNTSSYNSRIYAYEQDVRFAFSSQMYYGKGWRFLFRFRWDPWPYLSLWLRYGQSYYPGYDKLGSGNTTIDKNHRTEIKMQAIFTLR